MSFWLDPYARQSQNPNVSPFANSSISDYITVLQQANRTKIYHTSLSRHQQIIQTQATQSEHYIQQLECCFDIQMDRFWKRIADAELALDPEIGLRERRRQAFEAFWWKWPKLSQYQRLLMNDTLIASDWHVAMSAEFAKSMLGMREKALEYQRGGVVWWLLLDQQQRQGDWWIGEMEYRFAGGISDYIGRALLDGEVNSPVEQMKEIVEEDE